MYTKECTWTEIIIYSIVGIVFVAVILYGINEIEKAKVKKDDRYEVRQDGK